MSTFAVNSHNLIWNACRHSLLLSTNCGHLVLN